MTDPFAHFGAFLIAVFSHLVTLLAGCVVTVMVDLVQKHTALKKKMTAWKVDLVIILLFLFFACFQAWQGQYQSLQSTEKEKRAAIQRLDDLTVPRLQGVIESTAIGPAGPADSDTIVIVWAEVKNGGAASIAERFRAYIKMKDGREIVLQPVDLPKTVSYVGQNVPLRTVSSEEYLVLQAGRIPIPYGGAARGFLIGLARGIQTNEVQSSGNILVLEFADFTGRTYCSDASLDVAPMSIIGAESLRGPSVSLR